MNRLTEGFIFKLISNIFGLIVGLTTVFILPKQLGASDYGTFSFLTVTAMTLISTSDLGFLNCFFIRLNQSKDKASEINFYLIFFTILTLLLLIFIFLVFKTDYNKDLFQTNNLAYVILAFIWSILYWMDNFLTKIADSIYLTKEKEIIEIFGKAFFVLSILLFYYYNSINIITLFISHFIYKAITNIATIYILAREINISRIVKSKVNYKIKAVEYFKFVKPLVIGSLLVTLTIFIERWLVQKHSGASDQGYFSLSQKFSILILTVLQALTPIFTSEFAKIIKTSKNKAKDLYATSLNLMTIISISASSFLSYNSLNILKVIGKNEFLNASTTFSLLAFYPITQVLGQLSSAVLYSQHDTKKITFANTINALVGLLVIYLLVYPNSIIPKSLGSQGVAIKYLIAGASSSLIVTIYSFKSLNLKFVKYLYQCCLYFLTTYIFLSFSTLLYSKNKPTAVLLYSLPPLIIGFVVNILLFKSTRSKCINFCKSLFKL